MIIAMFVCMSLLLNLFVVFMSSLLTPTVLEGMIMLQGMAHGNFVKVYFGLTSSHIILLFHQQYTGNNKFKSYNGKLTIFVTFFYFQSALTFAFIINIPECRNR